MRKHVDGLHHGSAVSGAEGFQVAGLRGRVAAYVHNPAGMGGEQGGDDVGVHAGPGRVGDDDVGGSVAAEQLGADHVLHIAGVEGGVGDAVDGGVDAGIDDGLLDILDADD